MNYYERYCGDYGRDTSHLSLTEHGAYTVMLDTYYSTEKPLPPAYDALDRICRAMSKIERSAVRKVADEFFPIGDDGLRHNRRCDRDIPDAQERIAHARINGHKGGRPKKKPDRNPAGSGNETHEKPSGLADRNPAGTPAAKLPSTIPQGFSPIVENQEGANAPLSGKPDVTANSRDRKGEKTKQLRADAVALLNFLNAKTGRTFEPVPANVDRIVARLREFPADKVRQVIAKKCREWKGDDKMDEYLRPKTLFSAENFANYAGELVDIPDDEAVA